MDMATFRAQVVIPMFTNLPKDVVTNTLHFTELTPIGLQAAANAITPKIATWLSQSYAGGTNMANYMNPNLATVHWYDLSAPAPRIPYILPLGTTISVIASNVPTEVACVLSFQGDPVSGEPQSRRRGRVYLGALGASAVANSSASTFPTLSNTLVSNVRASALNNLLGLGVAGMRWSVWSPTTGTAALVTNGWVDNSPDTQRRRSVDPTSRVLYP